MTRAAAHDDRLQRFATGIAFIALLTIVVLGIVAMGVYIEGR